VVQVLEDDQGRSPGVAGSWGVSSGVEGVAKVGEDDGLPVAVPAELPVRGQGPPEAGDRLGVVAELTVRVAEAVPRQRLAVAVADGAVEVQGPLAVLDGALVISEVGEREACRVEGVGLPCPMADRDVELQRLPGVGEPFVVPALLAAQLPERQVDACLYGSIPEPLLQVERVVQVRSGVLVGAEPGTGSGDRDMGAGLRVQVAKAPSGRQCGVVTSSTTARRKRAG
jgi:hypothetical protein